MRTALYAVMWEDTARYSVFDQAEVKQVYVDTENVDRSIVPLYLSLEAAQAHATRGNRVYPDVKHYVVEVAAVISGKRTP